MLMNLSPDDVANVLRSMHEPSDPVVAERLLAQLDHEAVRQAGQLTTDPFDGVALAYAEVKRQLLDRGLVPVETL